MTITVEENPTSYERTGAVVIMSGNSRKSIAVSQDASLDSNAPEGYKLVWQDEFNSGSELNAADWTHEVQNSGWVNHELQNYVNHKTPHHCLEGERQGLFRSCLCQEICGLDIWLYRGQHQVAKG